MSLSQENGNCIFTSRFKHKFPPVTTREFEADKFRCELGYEKTICQVNCQIIMTPRLHVLAHARNWNSRRKLKRPLFEISDDSPYDNLKYKTVCKGRCAATTTTTTTTVLPVPESCNVPPNFEYIGQPPIEAGGRRGHYVGGKLQWYSSFHPPSCEEQNNLASVFPTDRTGLDLYKWAFEQSSFTGKQLCL